MGNKMTDKIFQDGFTDSPIFGKSLNLTDEGIEILVSITANSPVAVFQALNKALNATGFCFQISSIPQGE